jgi:uncharacterized protein (TIGR04255 family)
MPIKEIFPNPTVKQVIFQITFTDLFSIENKIGDIQLKIMEEFPESAFLVRRNLVFADAGSEFKLDDIPENLRPETTRKIWQFKSPKGFKLNIQTNSLDITSEYHKTYNNENGAKFRDTIELALKNFFGIVGLQRVNRLGLRYIDECPATSKDNSAYKSYYNTSFPLDRFNISQAIEMHFHTVIKKGEYFLRFVEDFKETQKGLVMTLDFDGFAANVAAQECLDVTDNIHEFISEEYQATIREPVKEFMRRKVS